ncbi:response regulator [Beggiatoa leptomitoformis]|uniref:histidine kinase n=1 Tax=Beggiatoa leptomitoformis TaxID=288004 RepID=A0A2N9YEY3_9GAMM|nr:response regulator [Beggiatoa leptomitoformis]AUI69042.1 response regulator [Beggiatoa leptomitoformis]QGX03762.1 response regulator [Beggiatoa leptomitoformis]
MTGNYFRYITRLGIDRKLGALLLITAILPFLISGSYGYFISSTVMTEKIITASEQDVKKTSESLVNYLSNIPGDLRFLSSSYAVTFYFQWRSIDEPYKRTEWEKNTKHLLFSFLDASSYYTQIQVLDADGMELIRVNKNQENEKTTLATNAELQNRKMDSYFQHTLGLKAGQVYLNKLVIDNTTQKENMLYYAMPIIDKNNVFQGIIVLQFNMNFLTNALKENSQEDSYLLINKKGGYLYDSNIDKVVNNKTFAQDYPALFKEMQDKTTTGYFVDNNFITSFTTVYPLPDVVDDYWFLIKQTNKALALKDLLAFKQLLFSVAAIILIIIIIVANFVTRRPLNALLQVNQHMKLLAMGQLPVKNVEYQSTDELGELVESARLLKNSIRTVIERTRAIASGDYSTEIELLSEQDQLGSSLREMTAFLRTAKQQDDAQNWLKTGQMQLSQTLSGEQDILKLVENIINFLTPYVNAQVGAVYIYQENNQTLKLLASHAFVWRKNADNVFKLGEGIVGQAALEKKSFVITNAPENYVVIQSGLGSGTPQHLLVSPFLYENVLCGVIELASFDAFTPLQIDFINQIMPNIAVAATTAESRTKMQQLLLQSRMQEEELKTQNEELQSQSEELQTQQEELRQTNDELEIRARELEVQKEEIRKKNINMEKAQAAIEAKAHELELASKYKSEFLANMSHELRTPLNSLLILSNLLIENPQGNLTQQQIDYAKTINGAGADLLNLINEILDLSKVEAGKIEAHPEEVSLRELIESNRLKFQHIADQKGLRFSIDIIEPLPDTIFTDTHRLKQIINNLLANAFKFTLEGGVTLSVVRPSQSLEALERINLIPSRTIALSVTDTGIGIPKEKQAIVFEAFQQADGTTSRRFGGTGLGLSISRQLSRLLGGEICLQSEEGKGSCFTLYLPERLDGKPASKTPPTLTIATKNSTPVSSDDNNSGIHSMDKLSGSVSQNIEPPKTTVTDDNLSDDRYALKPNDKFILIIEDDRKFLKILMDLAREKDFKCLVAEDGKDGLELAQTYKPHAIILDVGLPKVDGWTVMERLKENPETRHIPVHFMSGADQEREAKKMGAIGYLLKPISLSELGEAFKKIERFIDKTLKTLLVVVDSDVRQAEIQQLVSSSDVQSLFIKTLTDAQESLLNNRFDCLIVDIDIEHGQGLQLLAFLHNTERLSQIPVILYTARELTVDEEIVLRRYEDNLTVKMVSSPERLLDETTLFLHQIEEKLPDEKRKMLRLVHDKEAILSNKKVLIVDDDVRNTFALTTVLENKNMQVLVSENGKEGLDMLSLNPDISMVLMDVMMPEMDGYEAMRAIRAQLRFRKLPIIALTAKAMKGDKAKCIEAGANDYLTKPVDTDKLLSLMRVWLYR